MHREYIYNTEEAVEYLPVSLSAGAFSHNNRGAAETTTRLAHTEPLFLPIAGFMFWFQWCIMRIILGGAEGGRGSIE